jgi:TolA-binding protein
VIITLKQIPPPFDAIDFDWDDGDNAVLEQIPLSPAGAQPPAAPLAPAAQAKEAEKAKEEEKAEIAAMQQQLQQMKQQQQQLAVESLEQQLAQMGFSKEDVVLGAQHGPTLQQASNWLLNQKQAAPPPAPPAPPAPAAGQQVGTEVLDCI